LQEIIVGLEYGSDYKKALELVKNLLGDHNHGQGEFRNTVNISGTTGSTVQLNVRYWMNTDQIDREGHTRSEWIMKILEVLHQNGFIIK
jgi:small-conductance mechanosensitive channel